MPDARRSLGIFRALQAKGLSAKLFLTSCLAVLLNILDVSSTLAQLCAAWGISIYAFYVANLGTLIFFRMLAKPRNNKSLSGENALKGFGS